MTKREHGKDGSRLKDGEVDVFERGAICFSQTKKNGEKTNRCFILAPAEEPTRYAPRGGPFWIEGRFQIVETRNDARKASALFTTFVPR